MATDDTKQINVRNIPPDLLKQAKIKAVQEDRNLSDVVRELMENWVKQQPQTQNK